MSRLALALAVLALVLSAGCRQNAASPRSSDGVQIAATVEPNPPVTGNAQLVVTLKDASGSPISDATLSVRGDMTHAGMSPVLRDNISGQNGVYTVPFEWTMGGDWIVEVTAKLKDGTTAQQTFKYTIGEGSTPTAESMEESTPAGDTMAGMAMNATAEATSSMAGVNMSGGPSATATIPRGGG